jgi:23S rRNA (cytidine2498-2'-O)-methyltransferase
MLAGRAMASCGARLAAGGARAARGLSCAATADGAGALPDGVVAALASSALSLQAVYVGAPGPHAREELEAELRQSGRGVAAWHGRLALSREPCAESWPAWALDVWTAPRVLAAPSAAAARDALLGTGQRWWWSAHEGPGGPAPEGLLAARARLIASKLPRACAPAAWPAAASAPPAPASHAPAGEFALLSRELLVASPSKRSCFPGGAVALLEDRRGPPSRAYLKLWEAFARLGRWPHPGARCVDLGASPGGWSWALARLGCAVLAVDKAPLAAGAGSWGEVVFRSGSAFAMAPERCDWLFCDVACRPERTLELARSWLGSATNLVLAVKLQGAADAAAYQPEAFLALAPQARFMHCATQGHELLFCLVRDDDATVRPSWLGEDKPTQGPLVSLG